MADNEKQSKRTKLKKKAVAAAAGVTAACSIALASAAPAAGELFSGAKEPEIETRPAAAAKRNPASTASAQPTKQDRLRVRLRGWFLAKPSFLRGVVLLPFWVAGKALILLLSTLFAALSPVWQVLLGVLLNALLLFGLFALFYKLLFPNKRLRDLFTKRNIVLLAVGSLVLTAADAILRAVWEDYRPISICIKLALALIVLSLLCWRIFGKRRPRPVPAA